MTWSRSRWTSGPPSKASRESSRDWQESEESRQSRGTSVRGRRATRRTLEGLLSAQLSLRSRFDDFRQAFERRDGEAYRVALADFQRCLFRWTEAEQEALLPAILTAGQNPGGGHPVAPNPLAGRDPARELKLEWVQVRELTRYLQSQIAEGGSLSDILGLSDNLDRRLSAHDSEMRAVYFPAAAPLLTEGQWEILARAAPEP